MIGDASVAARWALPEAHSTQARRLSFVCWIADYGT
jgi:hypothetical protein